MLITNVVHLVTSLLICTEYAVALPGIVRTLAGGGDQHKGRKAACNDEARSFDGPGLQARFNYPWGIVFDHKNQAVYVADCACPESAHKNDRIRKVNLKTRMVTTLAGSTSGFSNGIGEEAHFNHVAGMHLDDEYDILYLADSGNHRIRVLYLANNAVDTIAGMPIAGYSDMNLISSQFNNPQAVVSYRTLNGERKVYVADTDNHAIRVLNLESDLSGRVGTIAGGSKGFRDGEGTQALFNHPTDLTIDQVTGILYITDKHNNAIRRLDLSSHMVTTLAGNGFGVQHTALSKEPEHVSFYQPEGVVFDPSYKLLYVVEFGSHQIRVVTLDGLVKTLAGQSKGFKNGVGKTALFYHPTGITLDTTKKILYITDQYNHLVRSVTAVGSKLKLSDALKEEEQEKKVVRNLDGTVRFSLIKRYSRVLTMVAAIFLVIIILLIVKPLIRCIYARMQRTNRKPARL